MRKESLKINLTNLDFYRRITKRYTVGSKTHVSFLPLILLQNLSGWNAVQKIWTRETRVINQYPLSIWTRFFFSLVNNQINQKLRVPLNTEQRNFTDRFIFNPLSSCLNPDFSVLGSRVQKEIAIRIPRFNYKFANIDLTDYSNQQTLGAIFNTNFLARNNSYRFRGLSISNLHAPEMKQPKFQTELSQRVLEEFDNQREMVAIASLPTLAIKQPKFQTALSQSVLQEPDNQRERIAIPSLPTLVMKQPKWQMIFPEAALQEDALLRKATNTFSIGPVMELVKSQAEISNETTKAGKKENTKIDSAYLGQSPSSFSTPDLDISRVTEQVYQAIERKIRIERERRGF